MCDCYTGDIVKNHFTSYLSKFVHGKRRDYLKKKMKYSNMEVPLGKYMMSDSGMSVDEMLELKRKEILLLRETAGQFPEWNELTDQKMIKALLKLKVYERKIIYQYLFEEHTFEEISLINNLPLQKVKSYYYYAIHKIRKTMKER